MSRYPDLGTVMTLSGAALLNTYVTGGVVNAGLPPRMRYTFKIVTKTGTALTSAVLKLQGSKDGTNYFDISSSEDDLTLAIEHTATLADAATQVYPLTCDGSWMYLQIAIKIAGVATGATGDIITVDAQAC